MRTNLNLKNGTMTPILSRSAMLMALITFAIPVAAQGPFTNGQGISTRASTGAATEGAPTAVREAFIMGTRLSARVAAPGPGAAAEAALAAVREVELLLSTWREDTELSGLNAAPVGVRHAVSSELLSVLSELGPWVKATGGAFDPSIGALVDAWDMRGEGRVPSLAVRAAALKETGWSRLVLDPETGVVTRTAEGLWVDAGAFGKGLALRKAADALRGAHGSGVLNFGGQVAVVGTTTKIEVAHPVRREEVVATLVLQNASASTTGASERYIEVEGDRYGHVLNPRTGMPVRPWGSVTVVSEDPLEADLLSTALFVMGPEEALTWAADRPQGVLVVTSAGEVRWNRAMAAFITSPPATVEGAAQAAGQDTVDVEELKRQVEAITRELERMRLGGDVVTQADTGILGFGPAASKVYKVDSGVAIGGYGEILFESFSDELEDGTDAPVDDVWDAYRGIVYFGYKFTDRLLVNTEIEIEHANEAFLEFAYLDYRLSDAVGFRGGLLLSPMGLVNELHEPPVFLGSTRPLVEQRIIPTTWRENGLGIFGDVGPFAYRAYVMNGLNGAGEFDGSGLRGGRQKGSNALAEDIGGVARVDYTAVPGLLAGGSLYYGGSGQNRTVTLDGVDREIDANTLIWEGHASYQAGGLDLRALVAGATVGDAVLLNAYREETSTLAETIAATGSGSVGEQLLGGYAHIGYDVLQAMDTPQQLVPYLRYEYLDTQAEVPEGFSVNPARERTAILVGASWKPVPQVAVKGDYQIHSNEAETGRNQFALVLSYLF